MGPRWQRRGPQCEAWPSPAEGRSMVSLRLQLLGGFRAWFDPGRLLRLPTRKAEGLVAYLAMPPGRLHPRDKLASLLWGERSGTQARASLRQTLLRIRRAVGAAHGDCLRVE